MENDAVKEKKFVKTKDIGYICCLIYFVVMASLVVIRILANVGAFSFMGGWGTYVLSIVTQVGLIFLLPYLLFKHMAKTSTKETFHFFNYKKISLRAVILSLVLGLIVYILNVYVSNFFNGVIQFFGYKSAGSSSSSLPVTWWTLILDILCSAVLPAICEETLHRGMLLRGLSRYGISKSIWLSGLLFGLLHLNIEQFFYATIIGLFLGFLCYQTSSVFPGVIVHFVNNATSVFLSFARQKGWAIGSIFSKIAAFLSQNYVVGVFIFVILLFLLVIAAEQIVKQLSFESFAYSFGVKEKELASMAVRENYFNQIEQIKNDKTFQSPLFDENGRLVPLQERDFFEFVEKNFDKILQQASDAEEQMSIRKMEKSTKIFLYGAIALGAILTLCTFIWGLL